MMKYIPLVNLGREYEVLKGQILKAIQKTCESGDYILGQALEEFENNFARFIGTKYAVGVASGTDALYLSLKSLQLEEGCEVIVPAFTFVATVLAVINAGLKPVLVDVLDDNYCINTDDIAKRITEKTKVVLPVHLYGYPSNMEKLIAICKEYNLFLIEDSCQAHGAMFKGKKIGSFGITSCFSFYPSKNIGCFGDGGMITTSDENIYKYLRYLRNLGQTSKNNHTYLGINSRLDTIQAAILNVKLPYLEEWNVKRREKASLYRTLLSDLPLTLPPVDSKDIFQVFHLFVIRTKMRNELFEYLRNNGIGVLIHYPKPIHYQESLKPFFCGENYPVAEALSREVMSLPIDPFITREEIEYICNKIREFYNRVPHSFYT